MTFRRVVPEIGRLFYQATTAIDALALIQKAPRTETVLRPVRLAVGDLVGDIPRQRVRRPKRELPAADVDEPVRRISRPDGRPASPGCGHVDREG